MFLLILFFLPLLAIAQTTDSAAILGRALDSSQAGVPGVEITALNSQTGLKRITRSDPAGNFSLSGLPVSGIYMVTASRLGFAEARAENLTLQAGATARLTLQLSIASGKSQVQVVGFAGETRTDEPQIGTRLDARQMEQTPLLNRRITSLPLLNAANRPAISQGDIFLNQTLFTTNGAGRRQTWYEVDGGTGTDSWGRQTIFSAVPQGSVQEMTVLTNAFSAEYGGSTGSVVNVVTKSGGSVYHGEVLELWRPSETAAALSGFTAGTASSGNQLTSDQLGQSAASLSGPLGPGTYFFTSGEFSRQDRGSPVTSPVAPGVWVGHYRGWLGFARIDRQLNAANSLFFRAALDGFHDTNPNGIVGGNSLPTVARVFRRRTYSLELGETSTLSPRLVNNVRLQFQLASPITQFDPVVNGTQYQVPISTGGTFTSGTSQSALLQNRQYQVSDTLSAIWGSHQLRFGGSAIVAHNGGNSKEFGGPIYLGQFVYSTCTQPLAVCESAAFLNNIANVRTYTQSYGNANYTVNDTLWSVFAQDAFRVTPDLTIDLGLRYEQQTFTDARKSFAPRVGFAYNPRADGRTVIRGGFGLYYSQVPDNLAANWALSGINGVFNYTASPGQIGFPATVASVPLPAFPSGAAVPVRTIYLRPGLSGWQDLVGYQKTLLNPYSEQWTLGLQRQLPANWVLSADYVGSHTLKINRPLDVDAPASFVRTVPGQTRSAQAANCTRPYWVAWYLQRGLTCNASSTAGPQPAYAVIQSDVNNGHAYYHAMQVNLAHRFGGRSSMLASYVWSHAIDNVDPDIPSQNPNDARQTGKVEKGNAIFDQRHRFVLSGSYVAPWKVSVGGIISLASGLPYNYVTGVTNSGDTGATADRPVINGVVVGRNAGRGNSVYEVSPFVERPIIFGAERFHLLLRVEAFNLLNRPNFVGYSGTYGNGVAPGPGFGAPLAGITNQLPARSFQFSAKLSF